MKRDIWMAVHKRSHASVAATDSLLYSPSHWENRTTTTTKSVSASNYSICRNPLGCGQHVTNTNVRAVFGDKAPLETIFLSEDELYERLATRIIQQQHSSRSGSINAKNVNPTTTPMDISPPLVILQELVFA
jgi:hypothetical protein